MTINKGWAHSGSTGFSLGGIFARLKNAVKFEIPVGYQDESGFHYGVKSAGKAQKARLIPKISRERGCNGVSSAPRHCLIMGQLNKV